MKKATRAEKSTAYHEAGHAVARYYLFHPIRKVTICPDKNDDSAGHCEGKGRSYLDGIDVEISPRKQSRMFDNIKILLAGREAQRRFNKRSKRSVLNCQAHSDWRKAVDLAIRLTTSTRGTELLLEWLRHETESFVQLRWSDIEAVAAELLDRKTLTGEEVREIISLRYGPLPANETEEAK